MKKLIIILCLFSLNVSANGELKETRKTVASNLNRTVVSLKDDFKVVKTKLDENKTEIDDLKDKSIALKIDSEKEESNPTVLTHGEKKMKNCSDNQELYWTSKGWECKSPVYGSDCNAASDEYKYSSGDKKVCSKTPAGVSIYSISYWKFRGYALSCASNKEKAKVYGCYYKNKLNKEIEISSSYCSKKSKPSAKVYICYADWAVGKWGACSKTCGGGVQKRSVSCPTNHICRNTKPADSQACNTSSCRSDRDRHGSDRDRGSNSSSSRSRDFSPAGNRNGGSSYGGARF